MRISRHEVGAEQLRAARENFPDRLSRRIRRQREAGRDSTGWSTIAAELLDYAGAGSVRRPGLDRDTWMAVYSAAEAYLGVVAIDGYSPKLSARVFVSYANAGLSYAPASRDEGDTATRLSGADWLATLCLAVIVGAERTQAVTLLETFPADALSPAERAFADHVLGEPTNRAGHPSAPARVLQHLDAARDGDDADLAAALRALVTRDRDAFWRALGAMLVTHRDRHGPGSPPRSLLPLVPIALATLAMRDEEWDLAIESGYLPERLVAGYLSGTRARVAPSPLRPVTVERPRFIVPDGHLTYFDDGTTGEIEHALSPRARLDMVPQALSWTMGQQIRRFQLRSVTDPEGRDPRQHEAMAIASQAGTAIFRAVAAPGDHTEVTIGHRTAPLRSTGRTPEASGVIWRTAVCAALLADDARSLDVLVALDPGFFAGERGFAAARHYRTALHAYLRGADATVAIERAVWARERDATDKPEVRTPPTGLLSRLVTGDPEGFATTLVEELEEHRDHFTVGSNTDDPDQLINIDILALAHHATAKGWPVPVRTDYLPEAFLGR